MRKPLLLGHLKEDDKLIETKVIRYIEPRQKKLYLIFKLKIFFGLCFIFKQTNFILESIFYFFSSYFIVFKFFIQF